ncbi:MAG: helix-turn-helix domain-containing protein [Myxococcota bacterium]
MSNSRPPEESVWVRAYAVNHPPSVHIPARCFERWGQFTFATHGAMQVEALQRTWVVMPHQALWIPPGVSHQIRMSGEVHVRTLFFAKHFTRQRVSDSVVPMEVSPLLRELVLHITSVGPLHRNRPAHRRLAQVTLEQLEVSPGRPLQLPMPKDPRARRATQLLMAPGTDRSLATVAKLSGASPRTLERLFRKETSLGFGRWRAKATAFCALQDLASGASTSEVAFRCGYSSASAFIAAFKRELGLPPQAYVHRTANR